MVAVSITPYTDDDHLFADFGALFSTPQTASSVGGVIVFNPLIDDTGGYWTTSYSGLFASLSGHITTSVSLGQLEDSSHKMDGSAFFGTGNATNDYLKLFDHTANVEFGLETHYRTGDYVNPVNDGHGNWTATMDAGLQNGQHNEQGSSTTRSAASFDVSMNFGDGTPRDGAFKLVVSSGDNSDVYTLHHSGGDPIPDPNGGNGTAGTTPITGWFLLDDSGHVLGLTSSPDGHVLQDSVNLAFISNVLQHGDNPADISAQDVHVSLIEMVGTVGVAQVSETIHLTSHVAA